MPSMGLRMLQHYAYKTTRALSRRSRGRSHLRLLTVEPLEGRYLLGALGRVSTKGGGSHSPPGAMAMAMAMGIPGELLVSASLRTSDPQGTDVFTAPLGGFPVEGSSYAVMSTGHAPDAFLPNNDDDPA